MGYTSDNQFDANGMPTRAWGHSSATLRKYPLPRETDCPAYTIQRSYPIPQPDPARKSIGLAGARSQTLGARSVRFGAQSQGMALGGSRRACDRCLSLMAEGLRWLRNQPRFSLALIDSADIGSHGTLDVFAEPVCTWLLGL